MTSSKEEIGELQDAIEMMKTESFSEMPMSPDRIPRGIEVDENRIYFYCTVDYLENWSEQKLLDTIKRVSLFYSR